VEAFSLTAGNVADARAGRLLLETVGPLERTAPLLTDRAYEDDLTRLTAWQLRFNPVVPPKRNRVRPWDYDEELYQRRNEVERLFRRLKGFRCVFTR
jgi:transposase